MLYKLKEKWNFKYFVVAEIGIILIINAIIFAILYIIAGLDSLYQNACYFFYKGLLDSWLFFSGSGYCSIGS